MALRFRLVLAEAVEQLEPSEVVALELQQGSQLASPRLAVPQPVVSEGSPLLDGQWKGRADRPRW